ncbi:MAG TPA: hypothetical protein PLK80_14855 [bacterium]|nr:hypothetical protein [bacterium]
MDSLIALIAGAGLGTAAAWMPYSNAALALFILLPVVFAIRLLFDVRFRGSRKASRRMALFAGFWMAVAFFQLRPSGLNAMLAPMSVDGARVGDMLEAWSEKAPNVDFECAPEIADKRISIHTITRVSIAEAAEMAASKADARATYERDDRGRSIAAGPHVKVVIAPHADGAESEDRDSKFFRFEVY